MGCCMAQMYAWSVASAQLKGGPLDYQLKEALMLQPPFDMGLDRVRWLYPQAKARTLLQ